MRASEPIVFHRVRIGYSGCEFSFHEDKEEGCVYVVFHDGFVGVGLHVMEAVEVAVSFIRLGRVDEEQRTMLAPAEQIPKAVLVSSGEEFTCAPCAGMNTFFIRDVKGNWHRFQPTYFLHHYCVPGTGEEAIIRRSFDSRFGHLLGLSNE